MWNLQASDTNLQDMHLGHHCTSVEIFRAWQKSVLDPERGTKLGQKAKVTCYRLTVALTGGVRGRQNGVHQISMFYHSLHAMWKQQDNPILANPLGLA